MKKLLAALCLSLFACSLAFAQSAQIDNENQIIGKATGALHSFCDNDAGQLAASISYGTPCFVSGSLKTVRFVAVRNCTPNEVCIQVIREVGQVTLDCNNDVINVHCGPIIIPL